MEVVINSHIVYNAEPKINAEIVKNLQTLKILTFSFYLGSILQQPMENEKNIVQIQKLLIFCRASS